MVEEAALNISMVVILWDCFTVVGWASFDVDKAADCFSGMYCIGSSLVMYCSTILDGTGGYALLMMPCIMSENSAGFPMLSINCWWNPVKASYACFFSVSSLRLNASVSDMM